MARVYTHITPFNKRAISYFRSTQKELKDTIRELTDEHEFLEELITLLNPCPKCEGYGEFRVYIAQDDTRYEACKTCAGTGSRSLSTGKAICPPTT